MVLLFTMVLLPRTMKLPLTTRLPVNKLCWPPTFKLPPMPTPPVTISAPDPVLPLAVLLVRVTTPLAVTLAAESETLLISVLLLSLFSALIAGEVMLRLLLMVLANTDVPAWMPVLLVSVWTTALVMMFSVLAVASVLLIN